MLEFWVPSRHLTTLEGMSFEVGVEQIKIKDVYLKWVSGLEIEWMILKIEYRAEEDFEIDSWFGVSKWEFLLGCSFTESEALESILAPSVKSASKCRF